MVFSFHELFPDFICANNTQSLVVKSFGVKILISVSSFASSSSPSCGEMNGKFSSSFNGCTKQSHDHNHQEIDQQDCIYSQTHFFFCI